MTDRYSKFYCFGYYTCIGVQVCRLEKVKTFYCLKGTTTTHLDPIQLKAGISSAMCNVL